VTGGSGGVFEKPTRVHSNPQKSRGSCIGGATGGDTKDGDGWGRPGLKEIPENHGRLKAAGRKGTCYVCVRKNK